MFEELFSISLKTLLGVVLLLLGNFMIFMGHVLLVILGIVCVGLGGYFLYLEVRAAIHDMKNDKKSRR